MYLPINLKRQLNIFLNKINKSVCTFLDVDNTIFNKIKWFYEGYINYFKLFKTSMMESMENGLLKQFK